jgi:hypothetical protein
VICISLLLMHVQTVLHTGSTWLYCTDVSCLRGKYTRSSSYMHSHIQGDNFFLIVLCKTCWCLASVVVRAIVNSVATVCTCDSRLSAQAPCVPSVYSLAFVVLNSIHCAVNAVLSVSCMLNRAHCMIHYTYVNHSLYNNCTLF